MSQAAKKLEETYEKLEASYEKFAEKTKKFLEESRDKTSESLNHAMDRVRQELEKAGEITKEEGANIKAFMQRDLEQTSKDMKQLGTSTAEYLRPGQVRTGFYNLMSYIGDHGRDLLDKLAEKAEDQVTVKTGEICSKTKLQCKSCDTVMHIKDSNRVPPCPKCHKTEFRRTL